MAGAVAAITSRATVGTWVMSALHQNAGIVAKAAETLDEISGGRFIFGLGAGHPWPGQARAFGLPEDRTFDRLDEALRIIVPLLRDGHADFEGTFHAARDLPQAPRGPRPGRIPIMIGGNRPTGQRHAVRHADIWSGWPEDTSPRRGLHASGAHGRRRAGRVRGARSGHRARPRGRGLTPRSRRSTRPARGPTNVTWPSIGSSSSGAGSGG